MAGEFSDNAQERAWKHRFAQILYEFFYQGGLDPAAALADAYAHADAQYLVRSLASPEDDAKTALTWIRDEMASLTATNTNDDLHIANPNNGARHTSRGESSSSEQTNGLK